MLLKTLELHFLKTRVVDHSFQIDRLTRLPPTSFGLILGLFRAFSRFSSVFGLSSKNHENEGARRSDLSEN